MRHVHFLAVALLWASPITLAAQADSVKHRNDCRLARQVLETGDPAPHTEWALNFVGSCGAEAQGAAFAFVIRRMRFVDDVAALEPIWRNAVHVVDDSLFAAELEVAGDPAAAVAARVHAIRGLIHVVQSGLSADYSDLVGGFYEDGGLRGVRGGCARTVVTDDLRIRGSDLPPDASEQVANLASRLRTSSEEPIDVQTAASCLAAVGR